MARWSKGYRILGLFLILAVLTGCSSKTATVEEVMEEMKTTGEQIPEKLKLDFDDVILQVDSYNVTYREVLFYIYQAKHNYEKKLGDQVWDIVLESKDTFEEFTKQELLKQMTEVKIICLMAEEEGVSLTKEEEHKVKQAVASFLKTVTEEEKTMYGVEEGTLETIFKENAIASKLYDKVIAATKKEGKKITFEEQYAKRSENVEIKMSVELWKKISIHALAE